MPKTKDVKRIEAEERHDAYRSLTPESRLTRIEKRPGKSARERLKLLSAIERRKRVSAKTELLKQAFEDG
jgi:hypothetical protein